MPDPLPPIAFREHGTEGRRVVVVHGGPGAPGSAATLAAELGHSYRVIEPCQRGSDDSRTLTVARHIADLHATIRSWYGSGEEDPEEPPVIVGHSWGAMLALAFAAAHPDAAGPLVLVGCGTFDRVSRRAFEASREARLDESTHAEIERLEAIDDPDERLLRLGRLACRLDAHDLCVDPLENVRADARAYHETWGDMLRLQQEGLYPAAFAAIRSPVLMLHGASDLHPGFLVHRGLEPFLKRLEYHELERCGHYPWCEREAREPFLRRLHAWILAHAPERAG